MRLHLVRHGTPDPERPASGTRRPRRGIGVLMAVADPVSDDSVSDDSGELPATGAAPGSVDPDSRSGSDVIAVRRITTSSLNLSAAALAERVGQRRS